LTGCLFSVIIKKGNPKLDLYFWEAMRMDENNGIYNLRNKLGLTLMQFAQLLDVSDSAVNHWEKSADCLDQVSIFKPSKRKKIELSEGKYGKKLAILNLLVSIIENPQYDKNMLIKMLLAMGPEMMLLYCVIFKHVDSSNLPEILDPGKFLAKLDNIKLKKDELYTSIENAKNENEAFKAMPKLLNKSDININYRPEGPNSITTMMLALSKGYYKVVETFIKNNNLDIGTTDSGGQSFLHRLFLENSSQTIPSDVQIKILKTIRKYKPLTNIDILDSFKKTPMICAAATVQSTDILKILVKELKANVDGIDAASNMYCPLLSAIGEKKEENALTLIKLDADVNIRNKLGVTPLHMAADTGQERVVEALLKKGANSRVKNDQGKIACDYAIAKKYHNIVKMLQQQRTV